MLFRSLRRSVSKQITRRSVQTVPTSKTRLKSIPTPISTAQQHFHQYPTSARQHRCPRHEYSTVTRWSEGTMASNLAFLHRIGPAHYGPGTVLMAGGMREGMWSISPHRTPEEHKNTSIEQAKENSYNIQKKVMDAKAEEFDEWIGSILRQKGHGDSNSWTDETFAKDERFQKKMGEILDKIERLEARPELYVWCQSFLKDIFRFSNEEGMKQRFSVLLGKDDYKNMIRYKTFVEKERYKLMRDKECVMEMQLQFANNLDSLQDYFDQLNPPANGPGGKKYIHPTLQPIYDSLSKSLAIACEVHELIDVIPPFFIHFDQLVADTYGSGKSREALDLIQQEAAFARGASKVSRGLLEYLDNALYEFEEYYSPSRVRNLIEYVRLEGDPKRRYKLDSITLPTPPKLELNPDALYRAIADATEGVVGNYEPDSPPYYPIEHIPFSEKMLARYSRKQEDLDKHHVYVTPEERSARYQIGRDEINSLREKRQRDMLLLHSETIDLQLAGYTDEELDVLGDKFISRSEPV